MSFGDLQQKTLLITGASSGIGRETAVQCARHGAQLILTGRNAERLQETLDMLEGSGHQMIPADISREEDIDKLVTALPMLNGVAHCAGIIGPVPAKFIRQEDIDHLFRINFETPVLLTARMLQRKKIDKGSSLVFISTIATQSPYFGGTLYTAAKSALEAYVRNLALELVGRNIRVNCLSPGLVNTPLINDPAKEGNPEIVDESLQRYLKKYPMGVGEAVDVANAIIFLLSDQSRWISGTNLPMGAVAQ